MAPLAGLVAHGGVAGAIVEALVALTVAAVFAAVWFRERRASRTDDRDQIKPQ
ncbi:MAG TPA: hypothetical protein VM049_01335 [Gaiellaceae bacterium]|nr:hypothetical protein [Gaiellaceae bacterium]